ncbi:hypothetical protein [Adhaeretor mobilis]|uniref:PEP-CTERM protein-sorting domain-containing protein n=1 Tax=Adhaeretor mobilis TaxID=1930276 RepID=A0A517MQ28_9BACT|nr:hypothetical protein [Adhaeretor mobilis]QDS96972.1 hypothetical protein HG15A2_02310 [Adhaeretor mobilis]
MRVLFLAASLALLVTECRAALVLNDLTDYTNDFNFLNTTESENFWDNDRSTQSTSGTTPSGSPGWYWQDGVTSSFFYGTGIASSPGAYSFQSGVPGDLALGSYTDLDGSDTIEQVAWGIVLHNNTGSTISEVEVTYTGEQYRRAGAGLDSLTFSFQTSSAEITDLEPLNSAPTGWQSDPSLTFDAPLDPGSPPFYDPPLPTDTLTTSETLTSTLSVNLPAGHFLGLRWHDANITGSDAGLAIDDLTLSFTAVPEPSAFLFGGLICGVLGANHFSKRRR